MTPTQTANLEGEYLAKARAAKAEQDYSAAAAWQAAASLLIEASNSKGRRRTFRPLDFSNRIGG